MKYLIIFLVLNGFAGFIIPQAFSASENLFTGTATFERLPTTISPNSTTQFEIKFQYTEGAYSLSNVTTIVDITPYDAASFVHFDAEPFHVDQNSIARIPVTITVDPDIEYKKIFLNISYAGMGLYDVPFKSSWSDSIIFDISPKEKSLPFCTSDRTACFDQDGYKCDPRGWECENPIDIFSKVIISPLKQFKGGTRIDKIQCSESLQMILKTSGTPACVKPESIEKLRERGWTNSKIISDELVREKILELTELLENGQVTEFNELRTEIVTFLLLERVDAVGVNLDGINLENTALPGADLRNATLKNTNIRKADLSNANLQNADLEGADLYHAKLWGVNLQGANLQNANLKEVSLRSADLSNANLQNADLEGADIPITVNLSNTDLRNVKNLPISVEDAKERGAIID